MTMISAERMSGAWMPSVIVAVFTMADASVVVTLTAKVIVLTAQLRSLLCNLHQLQRVIFT